LLQAIASQAAIAIENALLYANLAQEKYQTATEKMMGKPPSFL
jgi:GAF domain-containing protein